MGLCQTSCGLHADEAGALAGRDPGADPGGDKMTPITLSDVGRFIVEVLAMLGVVAVFGLIALAYGA